jgi:hypothetical protein
MAHLSSTLAYGIADTLAMELRWDHKKEKLTGAADRVLKIGDFNVPMHVKIIDSKLQAGKLSVLVRVMGNLMLLVTSSLKRQRVYLLNAAKYDGDADAMLANLTHLSEHKGICKQLGRAIVRVFESEGLSKKNWFELVAG